jgi:MFS family permease
MAKESPSRKSVFGSIYPWLVLAIIVLCRISNQQQRQMIGYAYGFTAPTPGDPFFEISAAYPQLEVYYGLLSGAAFTMSHSIASLFAGQLADKVNRKMMLGVCCVLWSAATVASGVFDSFAVLFSMRFLLGMLQAA